MTSNHLSAMPRNPLKAVPIMSKAHVSARQVSKNQRALRLRFYVNSKKWDIRHELKHQIDLMDKKDMDYFIFEDPDLLLPMMSCEGILVAGSGNITSVVNRIISK